MMNFCEDEQPQPTGRLQYTVFENGTPIEVFDEQNLIVDNSKQVHARLLGGDVTNRSVTQFAVGTNGTTPAGGNTSLSGAFMKALDATSYPATNQVKFDFSLSSSEANGMAILEFGLFTAGSTLYARRVRSAALNKDSDISISGSWTISF
jgi:hypothetical protein